MTNPLNFLLLLAVGGSLQGCQFQGTDEDAFLTLQEISDGDFFEGFGTNLTTSGTLIQFNGHGGSIEEYEIQLSFTTTPEIGNCLRHYLGHYIIIDGGVYISDMEINGVNSATIYIEEQESHADHQACAVDGINFVDEP